MAELGDLLRRRAERGTVRGADQVTIDALHELGEAGREVRSDRRSDRRVAAPRPSRPALLAVAVVTLAAVVVTWSPWRDGGDDRLRVTDSTTSTTGPRDDLPERWTPTAPSPIEARLATATATDGRRLFVWGGFDAERQTQFSDGALYDPYADSWTPIPDAPAPLAGPGGSAVWDGSRFLVLAPAGHDEALALGAFDPIGGEWQLLAGPPLGAREGFSAAWTGERLVVGGGGSGDTVPSPFGAVYRPDRDQWEVLPEPPDPAFVPAGAGVVGESVYFVAGSAGADASAGERTAVPGSRHDPQGSPPWTPLPPAPVANPRVVDLDGEGVMVFAAPYDATGTSIATLDAETDEWLPPLEVASDDPLLGVVASNAGAGVVLTGGGAIPFEGSEVGELVPADLSGRVGMSVEVVGDRLVVWGGFRDTTFEDETRDDGLVLRLDSGLTVVPPAAVPTASETEIEERCERHRALQGDLDGDGLADTVYRVYDDSTATAHVGVCTSTGVIAELPELGQSEHLAVVHLPSGPSLLRFGGTSVSASYDQLAAVVAGELRVLPLDFRSGFESGGSLHAWGCTDRGQLVTVEVDAEPGGFEAGTVGPVPSSGADVSWLRRTYSVDGDVVDTVSSEDGTPTSEQLSDPWELLDSLVTPCPGTDR